MHDVVRDVRYSTVEMRVFPLVWVCYQNSDFITTN